MGTSLLLLTIVFRVHHVIRGYQSIYLFIVLNKNAAGIEFPVKFENNEKAIVFYPGPKIAVVLRAGK